MKDKLEELVIGDKIITEFGFAFRICTVIGRNEKSLLLQQDDLKSIIFDFYEYPRSWVYYIPKKPWYKRLFAKGEVRE